MTILQENKTELLKRSRHKFMFLKLLQAASLEGKEYSQYGQMSRSKMKRDSTLSASTPKIINQLLICSSVLQKLCKVLPLKPEHKFYVPDKAHSSLEVKARRSEGSTVSHTKTKPQHCTCY